MNSGLTWGKPAEACFVFFLGGGGGGGSQDNPCGLPAFRQHSWCQNQLKLTVEIRIMVVVVYLLDCGHRHTETKLTLSHSSLYSPSNSLSAGNHQAFSPPGLHHSFPWLPTTRSSSREVGNRGTLVSVVGTLPQKGVITEGTTGGPSMWSLALRAPAVEASARRRAASALPAAGGSPITLPTCGL